MRRLLLTLVALGIAGSSLAQLRSIPTEAKAGEARHVSEALIEVDGARLRLAPGAQIRDAANRILMPGSLPEGAQVKYTLDAAGMVSAMWILTQQEALEEKRR